MSEEEKIFDIFIKECNELVKDKGLKDTIEELRNQNAELRDKLEEKNAELNKEKEKNKELEDNANKAMETLWNNVRSYIERDYISKDKIKAKIEEYNKQRQKAETQKINEMFVNYIDVLEELLGE